MKKSISTILTIALGVILLHSCKSDDHKDTPVDTSTNQKIQDVMQAHYLWTLPNNINLNQEVEPFFNSIMSPSDSYQDAGKTYRYSSIWKVGDSGNSYDPGFEYAINKYQGGLTYYVIYYVKAGTSAADYLGRGMYITKVNNTPVTAANAETLLKEAYSKGQEMKLTILTPVILEEKTFAIKPATNFQENPLFVANPNVATKGNEKVGYICYNNFSSGANGTYDNALATKLNDFLSQKVTVLVVDLRYNPGGGMIATDVLGSAIAKNRDASKAFMYEVKRAGLTDVPHNYLEQTAGKVSIPKLGDQLTNVYIITGQNTNGAATAFVNAMKAARPDVKIYGEKTKGQNIARGTTTIDNEWGLLVATSYMADANKKYDYTAGITPNTVVQEVQENAELKNTLLAELGSPKEIILSRILAAEGITTTRSASLLETEGVAPSRPIRSSISDKANNYNVVELDLNK